MAARCVTSYGVGGRRRGLAVFLALLAAALGAAPRGALARTLTGRPRPVKSSPSPSPPPALQPAPDYQGVYAIGDSITVAFNADDADSSCSNGDEVSSSWATSQVGDTCASELVYSYAERATCASSGTANTIQHVVNAAESGATIVGDLHNQAVSVKSTIVSNSRTALDNKVLVFLGHNDYCSGVAQKTSASCSSADRDPSLYCTMFPSAVERELNKALDVLITIPNAKIVLSSPIRVGQLCNFGSVTNVQFGVSCSSFWGLAYSLGGVSICRPLTADCSNTRVADSYTVVKSYRDKIAAAAAYYSGLAVGASSAGGAVKASGVTVAHSDTAWKAKIASSSLSKCDCFHPSRSGQSYLADLAFNGLTCSTATPCCDEPAKRVSLTDAGSCSNRAVVTSGESYPAL